jgi:hypothetical protein
MFKLESQISLPMQLPALHAPPPGLQPCLQKRSTSQLNSQLCPPVLPQGELHSPGPLIVGPGVEQACEQMFPAMHI